MVGDEQLAEGAGVDVAQLAALGEGDHHVGVAQHRILGTLGPQQLAAHAEVHDEHVAVAVAVGDLVEAHEQVLALALDGGDLAARRGR